MRNSQTSNLNSYFKLIKLRKKFDLFRVIPAFTWKFLKQHMLVIIQEILYPLMCHTDEDEDLFQNDPVEYIKIKYGKYNNRLDLI